jgi:outer membrane protein TolC
LPQKYPLMKWMHSLWAGLMLTAFGAAAQPSQLDAYIQQALHSNIALQQKELSYRQSLAVLEEAKGLFFPKLSIQARYSVARGGRAFIIPVGDLVNPVFQNLNLLNSVAGAAYPDYPTIPEYPMISNVKEYFLRPTEQESVLRLQMPVFNSAILYNHRIQENLAEAEKISAEIYRRELVKEVKTAYYQYAQAEQGVEILQNAQALADEALRTTESLYRNHQITLDAVYAAQADVQAVAQQLAEAEKDAKMARAYFNFLLNRDFEAPIELLPAEAPALAAASLEEARRLALQNREEFQQLNYFLAATDNQAQLARGQFLPQLSIQADYGVQGINYKLDRDADFFLGSAVLSWTLFDRSAKAKTEQAKVARLELESRRAEAGRQIELQAINAYYGLEAAQARIGKAQAEVQAARQAFRLVEKKFAQGQANLIEFTQSRTQMTQAEQSLALARYHYQAQWAEFERAVAAYPLP